MKYLNQEKSYYKRITISLEAELVKMIHTCQAEYLLSTNKPCNFSCMMRILLKEALKHRQPERQYELAKLEQNH